MWSSATSCRTRKVRSLHSAGSGRRTNATGAPNIEKRLQVDHEGGVLSNLKALKR